MSATATIKTELTLTIEGEVLDLSSTATLTVGSKVQSTQVVIASGGTNKKKILDVTDADYAPDDIQFIWVDLTDGAADKVFLEIGVDVGNDVNDFYYTVPLTKNLPFMLGSSAAYAGDHTKNFATGTLDNIEWLNVLNTSSDTDAKVRVRVVNKAS